MMTPSINGHPSTSIVADRLEHDELSCGPDQASRSLLVCIPGVQDQSHR
jgi:hypothetical protein